MTNIYHRLNDGLIKWISWHWWIEGCRWNASFTCSLMKRKEIDFLEKIYMQRVKGNCNHLQNLPFSNEFFSLSPSSKVVYSKRVHAHLVNRVLLLQQEEIVRWEYYLWDRDESLLCSRLFHSVHKKFASLSLVRCSACDHVKLHSVP